VIRALRVAESAATELADAIRWYEQQRSGLGVDFRDLVVAAFDTITGQPDSGSLVATASTFVVRRLLIPRFAYQVIYYLRHDEIVVVAVAHTSRRPNYWRTRTGSKKK
jgi:plasmid stabilization system protein ParE